MQQPHIDKDIAWTWIACKRVESTENVGTLAKNVEQSFQSFDKSNFIRRLSQWRRISALTLSTDINKLVALRELLNEIVFKKPMLIHLTDDWHIGIVKTSCKFRIPKFWKANLTICRKGYIICLMFAVAFPDPLVAALRNYRKKRSI